MTQDVWDVAQTWFGCQIANRFVVYNTVSEKEHELRYLSFNLTFCALALLLATPTLHAQRGDRRFRSEEQRKTENIETNARRLDVLNSQTSQPPEAVFLRLQISDLLNRARQAPAGSYLFDRLDSAVDNLLDASEDILELPRDGRNRRENPEQDTRRAARDLERAYFRITQGDYFANQSRESNAAEYVMTARRLYQQARAAFDAQDARRARRLADAAQEVISGLESLAQAAVPIPEPPRLPEN